VTETLVLLHGFGGTRRAWDDVVTRLDPERYLALALDLPGHGEDAACAGDITFDTCVAGVLARAPERFALCGYSLGGRVALHVALAARARVSRLALVSSSPGIEDRAERAERRSVDLRLAEALEDGSYDDFIERWQAQPLFAHDPPTVREQAREDQRRNDRHALAAAMRGLGTGEMTPLWDRLGELTMPVTVIVGERDAKFCAIGRRMVALLPGGELAVVPGGHRVPLENPTGLVRALPPASERS
jgi:2-succinyl-6-hydroxy-2,4-cyclohexadiene-1-carboxylate synthase